MRGKVINNSQPVFRDVPFVGTCPLHGKDAIVTVGYSGKQMCKTDLQKTYSEYGRRCNLLMEVEGVSIAPCIENCPLVTK